MPLLPSLLASCLPSLGRRCPSSFFLVEMLRLLSRLPLVFTLLHCLNPRASSHLSPRSAAAQNTNCNTTDNPTCGDEPRFATLCCPYPNNCYWENRWQSAGCCAAGQDCLGSNAGYTGAVSTVATQQSIHTQVVVVASTQTSVAMPLQSTTTVVPVQGTSTTTVVPASSQSPVVVTSTQSLASVTVETGNGVVATSVEPGGAFATVSGVLVGAGPKAMADMAAWPVIPVLLMARGLL